ncbi:hypothetical protein HBH56_104230 [Parastagonospora nodorum]|uniref:F-box domain-containing protein n=2 Tax=Phaeosphaeria nodorum (strain SN15 / ATCC MYA-4574 / FGSC 10173) TaxID=321614 RepID=A0A7U2I7E6_PHANO|nr:hypothetical protein SNOG_10603 [Parastagonospora nodorum SN15]KAH3913530.1 hypothetical protein HBH56_104230 [Parastagonospora nodorum]EAT81997.1 hypothetical protein SNOG_10603 [Parastagonospora nodorum SN15]KAH3929578.1 hypothetical protein HBH54_126180 [Parastagonospora nodorum]KAH3975306.1 hypothetical protein HBH52_126670 [Parastagonospora nodorum]KAH3978802.1 hypothetical protein HBH51_063590 [Parastagonospora nodorum]
MSRYQYPEHTLSDANQTAIMRFWHSLELRKRIANYLWPEKRERQPEANERAGELELCNAEFCPIYQLPPELLLDITKHISRADRLAFQLSSRRFASFIQRTSKATPRRIDKKRLKERLGRDSYSKLAEAEARNLATLPQLLCSHCHEPHPWSHFDRKEILESGHVRRCKGASRPFRTCRHITVTRDQLTKPNRVGMFGEYYYGPQCATCTTSYFSRAVHSSTLQYFCSQKLGKTYASNRLHRVRLQQGFRQSAWQVCPHMRTDDADFQARLLFTPLEPPLWSSTGQSEHVTDVFAEPYMGTDMRIYCRHRHCTTNVRISRRLFIGVGSTPIYVETYRELGLMKSVQDPAWLAQVGD